MGTIQVYGARSAMVDHGARGIYIVYLNKPLISLQRTGRIASIPALLKIDNQDIKHQPKQKYFNNTNNNVHFKHKVKKKEIYVCDFFL